MKLAIITGYAESGWEPAVSHLQQAGLTRIDEELADWHDALAQSAAAPGEAQSRTDVRGAPAAPFVAQLQTRLAALTLPAPWLLADARYCGRLDFWASQFPDAVFLLFYTRAETALAQALTHRPELQAEPLAEPQAVLDAWQSANQRLMQFQRRHRRRALLLDAAATCHDPEALHQACQRLGLALDFPEDRAQAPADYPPGIPLDPLARLVANRWLANATAVTVFESELEACATQLGETPSLSASCDADVLLQRYRHTGEQLRQLTQAQEKLTALVKQRGIRLNQARQSVQRLQTKQKSLTEEHALLLSQLHQVQETLETTFLKSQKQTALIAERQQQLATLTAARDEQAQLAAGRETELVALRQTHRELETTDQETREENALLLLQLHQVQETLEEIFLRSREQASELDANRIARQQLRQRLVRMNRTLDTAALDAEQHQARFDWLQYAVREERQANRVAREQLRQRLVQTTETLRAAAADAAAQQLQNDRLRHVFQEERQANQIARQAFKASLEQLAKARDAQTQLADARQRQIDEMHEMQRRQLDDMRQRYQVLQDRLAAQLTPAEPPPPPSEIAPARTAFSFGFGRNKNRGRNFKRDLRLIKKSELFDESWYRREYPEVATSGMDAVEHYLEIGAAHGCNPSSRFDTAGYLAANRDVRESGANPLVHYLRFGLTEGRQSQPDRSHPSAS